MADEGAQGAGSKDADTVEAPIDRAHLARYTHGDEVLERELLELFRTQSVSYLEQLRQAATPKCLHDAAHSLKGSARAVGAWRMAMAAEGVESLRENISLEERAVRIRELEASLHEAMAFIADRGEISSQ